MAFFWVLFFRDSTNGVNGVISSNNIKDELIIRKVQI